MKRRQLRVCFCAASIRWIGDHLQTSAKLQFAKMLNRSPLVPLKKIIRKRKKRFSTKQLAAQRLFAKRARAGTLRKGRRKKRRSR